MSKAVIAALACLSLSACAVSRHHLGFHDAGSGDRRFSMVGERFVKDLSAVEAFWVKSLAEGRVESLRPEMAPALSGALSMEEARKAGDKIVNAFGPTGYYEIVSFGVPFFSLKEGVKRDPFAHYDMVGTAFELDGKIPTALRLYVTKVDGALRICGFEVYPRNEGDRAIGKEVRFVFPEP